MKKRWLISAFLLLLSVSFVSAQFGGGFFEIRQASQDAINLVVDFFEPFIRVLLGGGDYYGFLLFEKLLFFILIAAIVYFAVRDLFAEYMGVVWIITIIVPLLGVRFINFDWINAILFQYQVFAIVLLAFFPFVLFLFFLHRTSKSQTVRRIGWLFFLLVYLGLFLSSEVGDIKTPLYFWTGLAGIAAMIFDWPIHRAMLKHEEAREESEANDLRIAALHQQLDRIEGSHFTDVHKDRLKKTIYKQIKRLQKRF